MRSPQETLNFIPVRTPDSLGSSAPNPSNVPRITGLFQVDSHFPETLRQVYVRNEGTRFLKVFVAACSVGSEVDDFLIAHANSGVSKELSITGVDIDEAAIEQARTGRHLVATYQVGIKEQAALESAGYVVDTDTVKRTVRSKVSYEDGGGSDNNQYYELNTAPAREGHNVDFIVGDLAQKAAIEVPRSKFDLVLANGLLTRLAPERATQVIVNLADIVAENGVLSLSYVEQADNTTMGAWEDYRDTDREDRVTYASWVDKVTKLLRTRFGLQPVAFGYVENRGDKLFQSPTMFARPAVTYHPLKYKPISL
jgi:chemotaxis methyl-accepting protein methylase